MKILTVFGTRPEAIKMASVIAEIQRRDPLHGEVCLSGQHQEMLGHILELFAIHPDYNLGVRRQTASLSELLAKILGRLDPILQTSRPDIVLVHGDTTTTLAATLAAFHRRIPVAHVEAGLRTGNLQAPWPEEGNRRIVGTLAALHFAPTRQAADNLRAEGVPESRIIVTGNTVIDSLLQARARLKDSPAAAARFAQHYRFLNPQHRLLLVTAHRRESFGAGFERICAALRQIALAHPHVDIVYPVHLNPNVQKPVHRHLDGVRNIHLIEPQDYFAFVYLMDRADVILTDSGGIQEEAPSLGKPVLVLRDTTERPEAVAAGTVRLVGTDTPCIVREAVRLLTDAQARRDMGARHNPYGDGHAAVRIVDALERWGRAHIDAGAESVTDAALALARYHPSMAS